MVGTGGVLAAAAFAANSAGASTITTVALAVTGGALIGVGVGVTLLGGCGVGIYYFCLACTHK
jgi:hypothetical protein